MKKMPKIEKGIEKKKKNSLESKQQQIVHKKDKNKKEMEGKVRMFKQQERKGNNFCITYLRRNFTHGTDFQHKGG